MSTPRVVPGTVPRQLRFTTFNKDYATPDNEPVVAELDKASCVTSEAADREGFHYPVIDIDHPCTLIETSTPGHFHLYIDKALPWEAYLELLDVMSRFGIVERGYYYAAQRRKYTAVRLPWIKKAQPEAPEAAA